MSGAQNTIAGDSPSEQALRQVLVRANAGDQTALPALKALLDSSGPELWKQFGDLARHVEEALVNLAGGKSLLTKESIQRQLAELRSELAGPSASPIERLLAERIALCWFQLHLSELDAVAIRRSGAESLTRDRQLQERFDRAHRRYLSGIKALATIRKLLQPRLSPIEISTRLERETSPAIHRRDVSPMVAAGIQN